MGAWKSLRNARDERAVDIAKRNASSAELIALLEPVYESNVSLEELKEIQKHFHALIRSRAGRLIELNGLRLPELELLKEDELGQGWYFAIAGMYGGFSYSLHYEYPEVIEEEGDEEKGEYYLETFSECRVVGGSGQEHRVTSKGYELIKQDDGY
jgi:hypothetical protein